MKIKNRLIYAVLVFFLVCDVAFVVLLRRVSPFTLRASSFTFELGTEVPEDLDTYVIASDRVDSDMTLDLSQVKNKVGTYEASVTYIGDTETFTIVIQDTTKPKVTLLDTTITVDVGKTITPDDVVASVDDASDTTLYFETDDGREEKLTFSKAGTTIVKVLAADSEGNESAPQRVRIIASKTGASPIISGTEDVTIAQDSDFDEMEGVSCLDEEDGVLTKKITVIGSVDTSVADTYTLIYRVKDSDGNTDVKTRKVTVQ